jgi:transmembrane sensor
MNHPVNWSLLAKYLSGECTLNEVYQIESWINGDPENQELVELLKTAWNTTESPIQTSDTLFLWQQLSWQAGIEGDLPTKPKRTPNQTPVRTRKWIFSRQSSYYMIWRYAAALLIFLLSALYIFDGDLPSLLGIKSTAEFKSISVKNGDRQSISLSDGSKVILDAGSKFRFPDKFNGKKREVYLTGEAFFKVASNPEKPFIVHANRAALEVVGTQFNIRAWNQERKITVTVSEGKVLLYSENNGTEKAVTLNQGYTSTVPDNGHPTQPQLADIRKSTGWIRNEIYFEDTPLREILGQLERWYDVEFDMHDSMAIDDHLTVHLTDRTLEDHLKLIGELADIHFVRSGKVYRLVRN